MITSDVPIPWITRVRLTNYKSIAECDVGLEPLTLLVGPNSAGKSNFLDALRFVGEAVATTLSRGLQARGGLDEVLTRTPEPASSFTVWLDLAVTLSPGLDARGYYAFEVGRTGRPGEGPPRALWEECYLKWPGSEAKFRVDSDGTVTDSASPSSAPLRIGPDRLYLFRAGALEPWSAVADRLAGMAFYHLASDELRQLQPGSVEAPLASGGAHIGDVLGALAAEHPEVKERIDSYLAAVTPDLEGIDRRSAGEYVTIEARHRIGANGGSVVFGPTAISDGTIRAAGVLAALFQPDVLSGRISLVGLEEPETAVHPPATAVLFDALSEASQRVQVIATTQSDDLIDRKVDPYDFDPSMIRAVDRIGGLTVIGEVNDVSLLMIREKRLTAGELMRAGQLYPEAAEHRGPATDKAA